MATVTAFTAARSLQIEQSSVTTGAVNVNGDLILTTRGGTAINAGHVVGPAGTPINTLEQTVKNNTGFTINKGAVVYISGSTGDNALISKAQANSEATSSKVLGYVGANILNGTTGKVITEGTLSGFDTSTAIAGDSVWLSPTVPGGVVYGIANRPSAPNHMVYLGVVVRSHAVNGEIYVKVQNGYELDELHDVKVTTPSIGQTLKYDGTKFVNNTVEVLASSAVDRDTKVPVPIQGMSVFRTDLGVTQRYYGLFNKDTNPGGRDTAGWYDTEKSVGLVPIQPTSVIASGGTATVDSLGKTNFTTCNSITLINVFSSKYKNYKVVLTTDKTATADSGLFLRLATSDGTQISTNYSTGFNGWYWGSATTIQNSSSAGVYVTQNYYTRANAIVEIIKPAVALTTTFQWQAIGSNSASGISVVGAGEQTNNTAYPSLVLYTSLSTISGEIMVYGYND